MMARPPTGQVVERKGKRGTSYGLRFRAYGKRHYVTAAATNRQAAEVELANVLADVRRGIWQPPEKQVAASPIEERTFHVFSSEWLDGRRPELKPRSIEALEWALSNHVLPFFERHLLSQITVAEVDRYRLAKVRERDEIAAMRATDTKVRERPLSNRSINATITVLGQVLDSAIEHGHISGANSARGKRRRLRAERPRRTWLELEELRALLDAAGEHRALLATMSLGGLRVGEATALRWGHVDLANGRLHVADAKTDAGRRSVDLSPDLRDELAARKAGSRNTDADDLVFFTKDGRQRDRNNVRVNVLAGAIKRANVRLAEAGKPPIVGLTNHSLRRTFASLLYEAGASPAYVMGQMGHTSSALALEVYSRMMSRDRDTGARLDALVRGADWEPLGTPLGTNGANDAPSTEGFEQAKDAQPAR
jgi:integrase